ncbi:hypothetical protein [Vibrio alginolyticus]|uniref:hypothetical protein n=1 Tax=Vibrio alginolyticus TaxID=663 RepID=UPI00148D2A40|nr:hypothetical protein [Vibrio alginolyticus]NOH90825.1 hypothetical protein [Vibrio alginolyticus]
MNYEDIKAIKLRDGGGVMLFNSVTPERKKEIIDAGDYERVIKRGELLKTNLPVTEAKESTPMNVEDIAMAQLLKTAEKDPKGMIDTIDAQLLAEINKLKASGTDPLQAHKQVMESNKGKKLADIKRQILMQAAKSKATANQGKTSQGLGIAKMQKRDTEQDVYARYSEAVRNGDTDTADKLAKIINA